MTYHEAFWVATATAAPVIALANTVSLSDGLELLHVRSTSRFTRRGGTFVFMSALVIYGFQVYVLQESLFTLYHGSDPGTAVQCIVLAVGGLLLVFFNSMFVAMAKFMNDAINDAWSDKQPGTLVKASDGGSDEQPAP